MKCISEYRTADMFSYGQCMCVHIYILKQIILTRFTIKIDPTSEVTYNCTDILSEENDQKSN